jgi:1-deoxy-D-xylulose-5-phosphate reductoisomerase
MSRSIAVLGSTGSIGRQTLDIARRFRDRITIYGLAAGRNIEELNRQIAAYRPAVVAVAEASDRVAVNAGGSHVLTGVEGMIELATAPEVDLVVAATGGTAGLRPALAALHAGKRVALANKEALVMAGALLTEAGARMGGELVPIDSEHSAIWQCLQGEPEKTIERLTLTASGGALRHLPAEELHLVTPEQALRHPTWQMGRKITVDSANLLNKGLEVLEAQWLFGIGAERIDVVQHAQSIVHSLVTFADGSTKAQLGIPDMRVPIQYALSHPERWGNDLPRLDLAMAGSLTFAPIDLERYPALTVAREAGRRGGTYPAVLVGADEVAVEQFLAGGIRFTDIPALIEETLGRHKATRDPDLDGILEADRWARGMAESLVSARSGRHL